MPLMFTGESCEIGMQRKTLKGSRKVTNTNKALVYREISLMNTYFSKRNTTDRVVD